MADQDRAFISVRGEATRTVEPDVATIHATITAVAQTAGQALADAGGTLEGLRTALSAMGGEPIAAQRSTKPLQWAARSIHTYPEHAQRKDDWGPTGRQVASVDVKVVVRDFSKLPSLTDALSGDAVQLHDVNWTVDADNPEWPQVRADAIRAALLQGQDYAAALGGSVLSVEHVADAGLLDGSSGRRARGEFAPASAVAFSGRGAGVVLDPEAQILRAVVEARFTASVGPLPTR